METPTKRLIIFNIANVLFSILLGFLFNWIVGVVAGVVLLFLLNTGYFYSKKQFDKLVDHNEAFRKEQEAQGNKIVKLNQKEYEMLLKNKVVEKDGQTIYLEDIVNGNKEGK